MLRVNEHHLLVKRSALGRLFEDFEFPVSFTNSRNRFVYVNRAFLRFYGYTNEKIIGLSPRVLMPRNFSRRRLADIDHTVAVQKVAWEGTLPNLNADGKPVAIWLLAVPVNPTASPLSAGYLGIACEERHARRLASELLKHMGSFTLNLAPPPTRSDAKEGTFRRGDRQREVMRLSRMGFSAKEIGEMMDIAASTVANVRWKVTKRGRESARAGRKAPKAAPRPAKAKQSRRAG